MLIVLLGHHQRVQEWNVSRKELKELVKMGVLTDAELEDVIAVEFNPSRVGFDGGTEVWVKDILNLGVSLVFSSPSLIVMLPLIVVVEISLQLHGSSSF
jgi:hypothetical protein